MSHVLELNHTAAMFMKEIKEWWCKTRLLYPSKAQKSIQKGLIITSKIIKLKLLIW